jgi:Raf kinase inhibitor-like YbhB/YbcL family protein
MMNTSKWVLLAAGTLAVTLALPSKDGRAAQAAFSVSSSSFTDGGMLTKKNAADDPMRMCGGENISPALSWSNAPGKTKSFVVFMFDPDGRLGEGVSHWVAYGIPANVTSFKEGDMAKASTMFVGGKGTRDNALYIGPCPPVGEAPHHYVFTVVATDLDPSALKEGMTRDEVYKAIGGHGLIGASIVGKFAR